MAPSEDFFSELERLFQENRRRQSPPVVSSSNNTNLIIDNTSDFVNTGVRISTVYNLGGIGPDGRSVGVPPSPSANEETDRLNKLAEEAREIDPSAFDEEGIDPEEMDNDDVEQLEKAFVATRENNEVQRLIALREASDDDEDEVELDEDHDGDDDLIPEADKRVYLAAKTFKDLQGLPEFNPSLKYKPKKSHCRFHSTVVDSLEAIYPGLWDVQENLEENKYTCTILFRDFVIRNGRGNTHKIEDLYVRFYLNRDTGNHYCNLLARRGKWSSAEVLCGYAHSHLSSRLTNSFGSFCLGGDIIIELMHRISNFASDPIRWKTNFEAFLMQLGEFVKYESLEGRPYMYIRNIGVRENQAGSVYHADLINNSRNIFKYMIGEHYFPEYTMDPTTGGIEFIDTEEYEAFLSKHVNIHQKIDRFGVFFTEGDTPTELTVLQSFGSCKSFKFRNQRIYPKLIGSYEQKEERSTEKYCHRQIKSYLEERIRLCLQYKWAILSKGVVQRNYTERFDQRGQRKDKPRFSPQGIHIVPTDS